MKLYFCLNTLFKLKRSQSCRWDGLSMSPCMCIDH